VEAHPERRPARVDASAMGLSMVGLSGGDDESVVACVEVCFEGWGEFKGFEEVVYG